jgi:hypothetical protein
MSAQLPETIGRMKGLSVNGMPAMRRTAPRIARIAPAAREAHAPFVIARVLDQGTMRSVAALLQYYGRDRIRRFFREGGIERVSRRTAPLWLSFLDLTRDECTPRSSLHRRSPFWTA